MDREEEQDFFRDTEDNMDQENLSGLSSPNNDLQNNHMSEEEGNDIEPETEENQIEVTKKQGKEEMEAEKATSLINPSDFKIELPKQISSFEEFMGYLEPIIHKIEEYIKSDFTSLSIDRKIPGSEDGFDKEFNTLHNSGLFHFYGALLGKVLVPIIDHESILFKFHGVEELRAKAGKASIKNLILEGAFDKTKLKSLELKTLKLDIKKNEYLEKKVGYNEEHYIPILKELVRQYDSVIEKIGDLTFRKSYFEHGESKKVSKSYNPLLLPLEEKVEMLLNGLRKSFKNAEDLDVEFGLEAAKGLNFKKKTVVGGAYEIENKAAFEQESDADTVNSLRLEEDLCRRLVDEYNRSNGESYESNFRPMKKLLQNERISGVSIYTVMLACIIFARRISKAERNMTEQVVVKELLEFPKYMPFPLSKNLESIQTKLVVAKALNLMLKPELENCTPQSAYFEIQKRFKEDINQRNLISADLCSQFLKFYHHSACLVNTKISKKFELYEQQLHVRVNTYKLFAEELNNRSFESNSELHKPGSVNINELRMLHAIAEKAYANEECQELVFLRERIAELEKGAQERSVQEEENMGEGDSLIVEDHSVKPDFSLRRETENLEATVAGGQEEAVAEKEESANSLIPEQGSFMYTRQLIDEEASDKMLSNAGDRMEEEKSEMWPQKGLAPKPKLMQPEQEEDQQNSAPKEDFLVSEEPLTDRRLQIIYADTQKDSPFKLQEGQAHLETPKRDHDTNSEVKKPSPAKSLIPMANGSAVKHVTVSASESNIEDTPLTDDQLKKKIDTLRARMSLEEAEKRLEQLEHNPSEYDSEIKALQEQIKTAEDWAHRYRDLAKTGDRNMIKIRELIDDLDSVSVRIEGMETFLEKYIQHRLWRKKFANAINILHNPLEISHQGMDIEESPGTEMISADELNRIIDEARDLFFLDEYEESRLTDLRKRSDDVSKLEATIDMSLGKLFDLDALTKFEREIKSLGVIIPQLSVIQARIKLNEEVDNILNQTVSIETLEAFLEKIAKHKSDINPTNYNQLVKRLAEAKKLQQTANSLTFTATTFDFDDIRYLRGILKEIEELKITFDEVDKLKYIVRGVAWLLKVFYMIDEDLVNASSNEELLTKRLNEALSEFRVEDIIKSCRNTLEDSFDRKSEWVRFAIEAGENIVLVDSRIEQLYKDFLAHKSPDGHGDHVLLTDAKETKDIEKFFAETSQAEQNKLSKQTLFALKTELQRIREWKALYDSVINSQIEADIRLKLERDLKDPERRESILEKKTKLQKLSDDYVAHLKKYSDLQQNLIVVLKYLNWITWLLEMAEVLTRVDLGMKISSYKELEKYYTNAKSYQVPKNIELYKRVESMYNLATETYKQYEEKFGQQKEGNQKEVLDSSNNESVKKAVSKHKNRPSLADALKMRNTLSSQVNFVSFADQVNRISEVMVEYQKWQSSLEAFILSDGQRLLESATKKGDILKDLEQVAQGINRLKTEFICLELRNEEDENKLATLEWQYRTYLLIKKLNKDASIDDWKKLLKYVLEDPEQDTTPDKFLTNYLQTEVNNSKKYDKYVQELIKNERRSRLHSLEDVKKLYQKIQNSPVRFPSHEKFLEELINNCKTLVDRANYLEISTEKEPLFEFQETLIKMKNLPVAFNDEIAKLDECIRAANKLSNYLHNSTRIDLDMAETIINHYKDCPVLIPEAQKLQATYEESKKAYEKYQKEICKYIGSGRTLPAKTAIDMHNKLEEIEWDFDGQLFQTKMQAYVLKIECLKKQKKIVEEDIPDQATFLSRQTLNKFVDEGRKYKKQVKDNRSLDQAVHWLENISEQADRIVADLKDIRSLEALEALPTVILGFVDYSHEIKDRKNKLLAEQAAIEAAQKKQYEQRSQKPSTKPAGAADETEMDTQKAHAIGAIQDLLQNHRNLDLTPKEARDFAKEIVKQFSRISNSQQRLTNFEIFLKNVLSFPYIAKDLQEKKFHYKKLDDLFREKNDVLFEMDRKLAEIAEKLSRKPVFKEDLVLQAQKRARTDDNANNLVDRAHKSRPTGNKFEENKAQPPRSSKIRHIDSELIQEAQAIEKQEDENLDVDVAYQGNLANNLPMTKKNKEVVSYNPEIALDETELTPTPDGSLITQQQQPQNSVSQIYQGTLKWNNERLQPLVGFYSCNRIEIIKQLPQIIDEQIDLFKIHGKMSIKRFDAYMNDFLSFYEEKKHFVISGWIEADTVTHQESCERIALEFLNESSAGLTKYLDCAKIFFIHKDQMPVDWSRKLGFKIRKVHPSIKPPSLAFILMHQPSKAAEDVSLLPKIIPKLVEPYVEPNRASQTIRRQPSFENSELRTPEYTSDEIPVQENNNYARNLLKNRNVSPITPQGQRNRPQNSAQNNSYRPVNKYEMDVEQEEYEKIETEEPQEYLPVSRASESNTFRSQFNSQQRFKQHADEYEHRGNVYQPRNYQNPRSQQQAFQPQQQMKPSQQSQQHYYHHHQNLQQQQHYQTQSQNKFPQQQQHRPQQSAERQQPSKILERSLSKLDLHELPYYPKRQTVSSQTQSLPQSATKNFNAPQVQSSNSKSQSLQQFYGSDRKNYNEASTRSNSQNVREILEDDNSNFYRKPPVNYYQAQNYGKNTRGNFSQKYANYIDEEDPRDVLNMPMRELEELPESDDYYASQRRPAPNARGEYFNQPAKISNTLRPNSQSFKPHRW